MSRSPPLTAQELTKFTTLVKQRQNDKLSAAQLANLDPTSYSDYIRQFKQQARTKTTTFHNPASSSKLVRTKRQQPEHKIGHSQPKRPLSFYYSDKLEIMSLKEFIIILEESKKKRQFQERASNRQKQKILVREVGRSIQSSHSQRNLRLTLSTANRINKRIRQNQYEHLF